MRRFTVLTSTLALSALVAAGLTVPLSSATAVSSALPKFKVTAAASATKVKTSHTFKISGKVSPASRATVYLQKRVGTTWKTVATKKLSSKSKYAFTINVGPKPTTLAFRVRKAKSSSHRAGYSPVVKVTALLWGTVKAWGKDYDGELGQGGTSTGLTRATPINVKGLTEVTQISAESNADTVYALRYNGTVWAWGYNGEGELGRGNVGGQSSTPAPVKGLTNVRSIAGGGETGYALKKDGTVWAWGANADGELGRGVFGADSGTVGRVIGLTKVVAIAAGYDNGYALKSDGTVWAWGNNNYFDLGQGGVSTTDSPKPLKVPGLSGIKGISSTGDTGYALRSNGTVAAWGYNFTGEVGHGTTGGSIASPVSVIGLTGVTRVAGSAFDSGAAIVAGGAVRGWGQGAAGELGNGLAANSSIFVKASGLTGVKAIAGADDTTFALMPNGTVKSFGEALVLGFASATNRLTPVTIPGLTRVTGITGAYKTGFAIIG